MIDVKDLTLRQIEEIQSVFDNKEVGCAPKCDHAAWEIGKTYLIRTVTMNDTGRLVMVTPQELVLEDAAWIADTGRFADAVKNATFGEVEPFPDGKVVIGRGAIIDAVQIKISPRSQK